MHVYLSPVAVMRLPRPVYTLSMASFYLCIDDSSWTYESSSESPPISPPRSWRAAACHSFHSSTCR